jgi:hypothetical protein
VQDSHEKWTQSSYTLPISPITAVELLMGTYILTSSLYLFGDHGFAFPTWQIVSAAAFYMVAGASIVQSMQRAIVTLKEKSPQSSGISN